MIITISREFGSGGSLVGHRVAERLGVPCYDKTVAELASVETGFAKDFIDSSEDRVPSPFSYANYFSHNAFLPICDQIFLAQRGIIIDLAQKGDCVIVGRCGAEILRGEGIKCFSVFIHAPKNERMERTAKKYGVSFAEAEKMMKKNDKARAAYHRQYCGFEWDKARNYDLCVNTAIGIDSAVALIEAAVRGK